MKIINSYSKFVSKHSFFMLCLFLIFSAFMYYEMQKMETQDVDYKDMLPDDYEVINAFNLIEDEFGSSESGMIIIQVDNSYVGSNEARSVLSPEVVKFSATLESYLAYVDDIESVNGFGSSIKSDEEIIPNDINEIRSFAKSYKRIYISEDESMALIKIKIDSDANAEKITKEISEIIEQIEKPAGVKVSLAGSIFEDVVVHAQLAPDMSKTSMFSMVAIVVILFLLFRNIKGVIIPLMTIIFGIVWTMGFLGLTGSGLSSMTSGAVSMIMGIGIDFGIQIMSRYNYELKSHEKIKAMERALNGILVPILTTALACLIGFRAMSLGELSMMKELGSVMSYGVFFCMIAAITIVPSVLVLVTKKKN